MGDEFDAGSLYVVFPDGSFQEMPVESVEFGLASEAPESIPTSPAVPFEFTATATVSLDRRAMRMLLGIRPIYWRGLLMHHRRRSPHGWRYRDR